MTAEMTTVQLGLGTDGLARSGCSGCGGSGLGTGGSGDCGCGGGCRGGCPGSIGCGDCADAVSERPRWFAGQLVLPPDLDAIQQWVLGRARRHNRMVHGWGIACGLAVAPTTARQTGEPVAWSLTLGAGYALSACGDEVSVPCTVTIDLRSAQPQPAYSCPPPVDPWCAPVRTRRDPDRIYYLAIRYSEQLTRPVRASACGCGCDDDPCEYSRIAEGYKLAILDELPECYREVRQVEGDVRGEVLAAAAGAELLDRREAIGCSPRMMQRGTRGCPDCCSPWLVLADVRVDTTGAVTVQTTHRRYLVSFANYGFTCQDSRVAKERRILSQAEREVLVSSFSASAEQLASTAAPDALVAAPALSLKGASRNRALRDLVGHRTIAELAKSDVGGLRAAAVGMGAEPEVVQQLHDLASLVVRLAKG